MKHCPRCQSTYTDDTLQFCLQDGAVLINASEAPPVTNASGWSETEAPTVVRQTVSTQENQFPPTAAPTAAPKKSSTGLVIFLTALATLLLVGGGIGAWLLLRNRAAEVAVNSSVNTGTPKPSNKNSANTNANKTNANASPTATPPQSNTNSNSAPPDIDAEQIKTEVSDKVDDWAGSLESGDLNAHMSNYADRLDYYYNSRNASVLTVRGDKQRAFAGYDEMRVQIDNLRVIPDASGEKATAVFDKEWEFEGADSRNKGKTQSQLQLTKINGAWRITGEKDIKIYYVEK